MIERNEGVEAWELKFEETIGNWDASINTKKAQLVVTLIVRSCFVTSSMDENQIANMDKAQNVILDIESLTQPSDKCSGSPKVSKALSRKGSCRMERRGGEEQEADDASRKLVVKVVCSQLDQLKQPLAPKTLSAAPNGSSNGCLTDSLDGRNKRFNRLTTIHPRKIFLLFASMSSMGTMILIYFTLSINRRGGA